MATERTWVLIAHDGGEDVLRTIDSAFDALGIPKEALKAECTAPYDEMLSLADSKRAIAEVEKSGELTVRASKMFDDMKAERDHVINVLKIAEEMNEKVCAERDKAREALAFTKRHLATAVELLRESSQIMNDDTTFLDKLFDAAQSGVQE